MQVISGHVQGDEVEVQCESDGGLDQACLRLRRVVCSDVMNCCEFVVVMMKMKMMMMARR